MRPTTGSSASRRLSILASALALAATLMGQPPASAAAPDQAGPSRAAAAPPNDDGPSERRAAPDAPERPAEPGKGTPPNRPEKGEVYDDLEADDNRCRGGYAVRHTDSCTHGPDTAPEGVDISKSVEPISDTPSDTAASQECFGDGSTGKRTTVIYARASDRADRFATFESSIRQWASQADDVYHNSAAETGGSRHIRFVHDANCQIRVFNAIMGTTGDDSFSNTQTALKNLGFNRTDRKYMVFVDANVYCGIGNIKNDDRPGSANLNNGGPSYGRTDAGCWGAPVAAHEHMHNIGGVQLSAPHTSGGWHCTDEWDRMCYSDTPNFPTMQILCPNSLHDGLFDCNHDDYYSTNPRPGSYLATRWNAANSQFLVAGPQSRWGYVWANQPTAASYTPSNTYQFNSSGATNTIVRTAVGTYTVKFPNLAASAGTVHVSAYGTGSQSCKVVNWFPSGSEEHVNVACFNSAGSRADALFTVSFNLPAGNIGPLGHVWADQPSTASYTPSASYRFNSSGGTNTISRSGVGAYTVRLPGLAASAGNVKVTAYGGGSELCKVGNWFPSGADQLVNVRCYSTSGAAVDTRFTMTYARNMGITGIPGQPSGYAWANQSTTASYTPSTSYKFNSSGGTNTISRSGVGAYTLSIPGVGVGGGHVQVSAYGSGTAECKVASWFPSGGAQKVNVRCFSTTGAPVDSLYTVTFTK